MSEHPLDQFLTACGLTGPLQLHITSPDGHEVVHLTLVQPFALIGSSPNNDLALPHSQVSRRHAYLQAIGGSVFCVDLSSRTGTRWEGRAERSGWLGTNRSLGIGPYRIQAEVHPASETLAGEEPLPAWNPLAVRAGDQARLPEVALEFLNGQTRQPFWPVRSTLALVGRLPGCQVRLIEASVSRFHCSLLRTPLGVWVIDLLGREGVRVNGERLRQARLEDGDQLQVGRFQIRIHCRPAAAGQFALPGRSAAEMVVAVTDEAAAPEGSAPSRQLVPAAPGTLPLAPAAALPTRELADSLLVPLMSQFNVMQQQMFDQFHQSVLVMVQMFSSLHRDQMGLIREELDRLHQLTQELHALQAELARQSAAPAAPQPAPPPKLDDTAAELLQRMREMLQAGQGAAAPSANGELARPAPAPQPAPPATPVAGAPAPPAAPPPPIANGAAPQPAKEELHDWLQERIAALQQERETRWQKILHFMLGR